MGSIELPDAWNIYALPFLRTSFFITKQSCIEEFFITKQTCIEE